MESRTLWGGGMFTVFCDVFLINFGKMMFSDGFKVMKIYDFTILPAKFGIQRNQIWNFDGRGWAYVYV